MGRSKRRHRCVCCRKLFFEDQIERGPDPYEHEINDDDTPVWMCGSCREERAADI